MSKRIRELLQHLENKIVDHERKRDALLRQRDALIHDLAEKHVPIAPIVMGFDLASGPDETGSYQVATTETIGVEPGPTAWGNADWFGVFSRLTLNHTVPRSRELDNQRLPLTS